MHSPHVLKPSIMKLVSIANSEQSDFVVYLKGIRPKEIVLESVCLS